MRVIVTLMTIDHVMDKDILEGEDIIRIEVEDHQIEKIIKIEGIQEVEDPQMIKLMVPKNVNDAILTYN